MLRGWKSLKYKIFCSVLILYLRNRLLAIDKDRMLD